MLQDCKVERLNNGGKGNKNQNGGQAAEIAKFKADVMEVIKKGCGCVFSLESSNSGQLATLEMKKFIIVIMMMMMD